MTRRRKSTTMSCGFYHRFDDDPRPHYQQTLLHLFLAHSTLTSKAICSILFNSYTHKFQLAPFCIFRLTIQSPGISKHPRIPFSLNNYELNLKLINWGFFHFLKIMTKFVLVLNFEIRMLMNNFFDPFHYFFFVISSVPLPTLCNLWLFNYYYLLFLSLCTGNAAGEVHTSQHTTPREAAA